MRTLTTVKSGPWLRLSFALLPISVLAVTVFALPARGQTSKRESLRVGIIGDQYGSDAGSDPYPVMVKGLDLLKQEKLDVILHTGDLIEGHTQAEYEARFTRAATMLDQAQIPWYLTPGDHDVNPPNTFVRNSSDRSTEKLFFANYSRRRPELSPGLYYSFNVGGYHFIALNSLEHLNCDIRWGDAFLAKLSDEQFIWLQVDLAKHRSSRGIVVFMHQPLWYNVAAWLPVHRLLRQYPVQVVLAGHTHYNQDEGELDGIRYLIVGATGAKVKQGSPETGHAQLVTVMTLNDKKLELKLLPIGSDSPRIFANRLDMDRIQALETALDVLGEWQPFPGTPSEDNAVCRLGGRLLMSNDLSPAAIRLRAIGNPIDVPVRFEVRVDADGLPPVQGRFASGLCEPVQGEGCVLAPGTNTTVSNLSSVEFRWADSTGATKDQKVPALPPLWEAFLPTSGLTVRSGTTFHVRVKYAFPVESGAKYVAHDLVMVVNDCSKLRRPDQ